MKDLYLKISRHNNQLPAEKINPNPIKYNELTIVLKGELEYIADGRSIVLRDGDAIFLSVGTVRARRESEGVADYISFNFTCDGEIALPTLIQNTTPSEVLLLIAAYDKINSRTYLDNTEKNKHLLVCLLEILSDRVKTQNFTPLTLQIIKYIHSSLSEKITLEDIGRLTFFSPIYCDTVFKREMGQSIIDYLLDRRIEEAKKMLVGEPIPLSQIAEAVGFSDYNYFSRTFKKRSGYSPAAYRRAMISGDET